MKKLILSLSLFLSFSTLVHAQWTTNGAGTTTTGAVGIGTTIPQSILHISGTGTFINQSSQIDSRSVIIQAITGGRGVATGAQIEFAIPANTDGSNIWGQARIVTVAGNSNNNDATGKMILGTRRMFNKTGAGATWYYGDDVTIDGGGNVGIGTTTPLSLLQVNGNIAAKAAADANNSYLLFQRSSDGYVGARLGNSYSFSGYGGHLVFETNDGGGPTSLVERLRITNSGNVGIGITNPQNKLDVNGTVHSKAVTIDLNGWSDYVFKKDYQLRPLSEVKNYVDQNQHLPEIPSEQEMIKKGLDVGEMNKLLIKKVEELTLYLIEQNKRIEKLESQLNKTHD